MFYYYWHQQTGTSYKERKVAAQCRVSPSGPYCNVAKEQAFRGRGTLAWRPRETKPKDKTLPGEKGRVVCSSEKKTSLHLLFVFTYSGPLKSNTKSGYFVIRASGRFFTKWLYGLPLGSIQLILFLVSFV